MTEIKSITETSSETVNTDTGEREIVHVTEMHSGITVKTARYYDADARTPNMVVTDYHKGENTYRVVDFRTRCGFGRQNAEMFQIMPSTGRVSMFKHVENAHARAIGLLLANA